MTTTLITHAQLCLAAAGQRVPLQGGYLLFRAKHGGWHTSDETGLTGFDATEDDQHWGPGHYSEVTHQFFPTESGGRRRSGFVISDETFEYAFQNDLDIDDMDGGWT